MCNLNADSENATFSKLIVDDQRNLATANRKLIGDS